VRYVAIGEADLAYVASDECRTSVIPVSYVGVQTLDDRLWALRRAIGDAAGDEYWTKGVSILKRCRFNVLATPLPATHSQLGVLSALTLARDHFKDCRAIYAAQAPLVEAACDAVADVFFGDADPLTAAIEDAVSDGDAAGRVGVLLPSYGFEQAVAQHLRSRAGLSHIDAVTVSQLETKKPFARLFVIGSASWYRRTEWIFTAPRAHELLLVSPDWMLGHAPPSDRSFSRSRLGQRAGAVRWAEVMTSARTEPHDDPGIGIDWDLLSRELPAPAGGGNLADAVEARLFLLADGRAAFLGATADSRVPALDPDAPAGERVETISTNELVPGAIVLLRSEGGGDLIVSTADKLLGAAASRLREMQEGWKKRVRNQIDANGVEGVVAALKRLGSPRATRNNLLNWASPRSLRTADEADFFALMSLIGEQGEDRTYWNAMGRLDQAHRRAGFKIRDQLEAEAERADLLELQATGWLDFKLPDGGGALTAFRVEDISPQTFDVPYQQLGEPFRPRF
jgi:hypothetical protein